MGIKEKLVMRVEESAVLMNAKSTYVNLRDADETALHKRLDNQLAPWAVGGSVVSLALLGSAMNPGYNVGVGGLAIAALTAGLYIPKMLDMSFVGNLAAWARKNKTHTWLCASAAFVWYTAAVILGYGEAKTLVLTGFSALLLFSARWWQTHRIADPVLAPAELIVSDVEELIEDLTEDKVDQDAILTKWADRVGSASGSLPGARLEFLEDVKAGSAYRLMLVPGRQTLADVQGAMPRIATGLGVPQQNLLAEFFLPDESDTDAPDPDPAVIKFQVIKKSPIRVSAPLNGPTWQSDGKTDLWIDLGVFADGEGTVKWKVFTENSLWGGYVVGDTGSGKSVISDTIGMSLMDTGLVTVFYIDPQDGTSSPSLFEHADWSVGNDPARWERMLTGLETLIDVRGAENKVRLKTGGFTPSPQRPGVVVIVDECHGPFSLFTARWAKAAKQGRKVGVALIGLSQIYGLDAFGGDDSLRQALTGANTIALRVGRNQASLIHGLPINPADLPNIPGYGVVVASDPKFGRTAPFRGYYAKEGARAVMFSHVVKRMPRLDNIAIGALDDLTEDAYSLRHHAAVEDFEALEHMLQSLEAGLKVSVPKQVIPAEPGLLPVLGQFADGPVVDGEKMVGAKKIVFEAIKGGVSSTGELLEIVRGEGFTSESWVFDSLRELVEAELIEQVKKGTYRTKERVA